MAKRAEFRMWRERANIRIKSRFIIANVITRLTCVQMPFGIHF